MVEKEKFVDGDAIQNPHRVALSIVVLANNYIKRFKGTSRIEETTREKTHDKYRLCV